MAKTIKISADMDELNLRPQVPFFEELASCNDDVVIDIADVSFIDSSGIGGLVFLFKRLREHGHTLRIVGARGQPLDLFRHLRLDSLLVAPSERSPAVVAADRMGLSGRNSSFGGQR